MLTVVEDTSGGVHDTLVAACDRWRYEELGAEGYHENCADNLVEGLKELGKKCFLGVVYIRIKQVTTYFRYRSTTFHT